MPSTRGNLELHRDLAAFAGGCDYVRITVSIAPFLSLTPPNTSYNVASLNVPTDDENTAFYFIAWGRGLPGYRDLAPFRPCGAGRGPGR